MKVSDDFIKNFRWITPIMLSILSLCVTILIFVVGSLINAINNVRNDVTAEIRGVRQEVKEVRTFAIQYTDKMTDLVMKSLENRQKNSP